MQNIILPPITREIVSKKVSFISAKIFGNAHILKNIGLYSCKYCEVLSPDMEINILLLIMKGD